MYRNILFSGIQRADHEPDKFTHKEYFSKKDLSLVADGSRLISVLRIPGRHGER